MKSIREEIIMMRSRFTEHVIMMWDVMESVKGEMGTKRVAEFRTYWNEIKVNRKESLNNKYNQYAGS